MVSEYLKPISLSLTLKLQSNSPSGKILWIICMEINSFKHKPPIVNCTMD